MVLCRKSLVHYIHILFQHQLVKDLNDFTEQHQSYYAWFATEGIEHGIWYCFPTTLPLNLPLETKKKKKEWQGNDESLLTLKKTLLSPRFSKNYKLTSDFSKTTD